MSDQNNQSITTVDAQPKQPLGLRIDIAGVENVAMEASRATSRVVVATGWSALAALKGAAEGAAKGWADVQQQLRKTR